MKKTFILVILLVAGFFVQAQVLSYGIDASKSYDNNTKTVYLSLEGFYTETQARFIEKEILLIPEIKHFSFYDQSNSKKCMYSSDVSFDDTEILEILNYLIEKSNLVGQETGSPQAYYAGNQKTIKIFLSNVGNKSLLIDELYEISGVVSVDINNDNVCKIVMEKDLPWSRVEEKLRENGVNFNSGQ